MDETQGVRSVSRLLALDVHVKAIRGESESALQSLMAMFAASDSISHQLTVVEQLVRIGTLGPAMRQVELVLNELPLDDHQLVELSQRLAVTDIQSSFTRADRQAHGGQRSLQSKCHAAPTSTGAAAGAGDNYRYN